MPAALDIVNTVLDEKASEKLKLIPLSDNTLSRRTGDIAQNLENQLKARLKSAKYFAIQLDESTDVSSSATLLVYVRYIWQGEFVEDLLCCLTLPSSMSGARIFEELNAFMTKCGLDWANCKGITSDGAANMTGKNSGVVRRIKDAAGQNIVWNHCFIHREALASKRIPPELEVVMKDIIKVVNFIKGSALNSRLFEALCTEMGAEHKHLLFHTDVRWLSKGRAITRVYELRDEIHAFLTEKLSPLTNSVRDEKWLLTLSYFADIFSVLSELNLNLQGREDNIFRHCKQIQAFQKSLELWQLRLKTASYYMFLTMMRHIEENNVARNRLLV